MDDTIETEDELKQLILPLLRQASAEMSMAQIAAAMGEALAALLDEEKM